ncbi:unnamed protein product [Phyllotreta striolata]|uniref:Protein NATD1 n=1 Tax=Phyllotreta striolata TaxID=444603 RepID=A0A9N9TK00_PHYSR|nr:unnamed protein product [Phyllotreta striolata]
MNRVSNINVIKTMLIKNPVEDVAAKKMFRVALNKSHATLIYNKINPNTYDLIHTFIPKRYQGTGLGSIFAFKIFDYLIEKNLKYKLTCEFLIKICDKTKGKYELNRIKD